MKHIYNSLALFTGLILLQSCENDLEKSYYSESQAKPAVLENISENIIIDNLKPEEVALSFKWEQANVGYNAAITNNLEMDIASENNFGNNKITLYSNAGKGSEVSLTNKELNDQIIALLKNYADENGNYTLGPTNLQFRVSSSISDSKSPLVSNIVSSLVTPYDNESTGYKAPVITSTEIEDINLNATDVNAIALSLAWTPAYLGDNAGITYNVVINMKSEVEGYSILKKTTVATVKNQSNIDITYKELNTAVLSLLEKYDMSVSGNGTEIELSINATKNNYPVEFQSETITINVMAKSEDIELDYTYNNDIHSFSWTPLTGAKYQLEMSLNPEFSQRSVIASDIAEAKFDILSDVLNKAVKYQQIVLPEVSLSSPITLYFRVKAYYDNIVINSLSSVLQVQFTYTEVQDNTESIYFIGGYYQCVNDGTDDWRTDYAQKLYKQEDGSYKAQIMAYDLTNGWKINQGNSWWGTPINEGIMTLGGYDNNVTSYGSNGNTSYLVTFSPTTGKLKMENEEKRWKVIGDFNDYSSYGDEMDIYRDNNNEWYAHPHSDIELKAGEEWVIKSFMNGFEIRPTDVEGHFEKSKNNKFIVSEGGKYDIRWYFNKPVQYVVVIKK